MGFCGAHVLLALLAPWSVSMQQVPAPSQQLQEELTDALALMRHGSPGAVAAAATRVAALAADATLPATFRHACIKAGVVQQLVHLLGESEGGGEGRRADGKERRAGEARPSESTSAEAALMALASIATDDPTTEADNGFALAVCAADTYGCSLNIDGCRLGTRWLQTSAPMVTGSMIRSVCTCVLSLPACVASLCSYVSSLYVHAGALRACCHLPRGSCVPSTRRRDRHVHCICGVPLRVYALRACAPRVQCVCAARAPHVRCACAACALHARCMRAACALHVRCMCTAHVERGAGGGCTGGGCRRVASVPEDGLRSGLARTASRAREVQMDRWTG